MESQAGNSPASRPVGAPSAAQDNDDAKPSMSREEILEAKRLVREIRTALPQLPGDKVAELTNLLSTVEGHLDADPPNPVATAEAIALVRDELAGCPDSKLAERFVERTAPLLKRLGEVV